MQPDELLQRIKSADAVHGPTIGPEAEVSFESAPWYRKFQVVRVLVRLRHKPLLFVYADDGQTTIPLGSEQGVYRVNEAEDIALSADDIPAYVRFFLEHSGAGPRIVESAEEVRWLPAADTDADLYRARQLCATLMQPIRVSQTTDGFNVVVTALEQRTLFQLVLAVTTAGRVSVISQAVLQQDVPVPYVGV